MTRRLEQDLYYYQIKFEVRIKRAIFRLAKPEKAQPTLHARAENACILCRAARRKTHIVVNLLSVDEHFKGERNAENLCKRVKHKVYFVIE